MNTSHGQVPFPAATCTCPILKGVYVVDVNGGNMQGSCQPTSVSSIWSGYFPRGMQPQAITDWQNADSPAQLCGAKEMQGTELANCFSFNCSRAGQINGTDVATCTCALGEDFEGNPVPADTAFFTQAGQCDHEGTGSCTHRPIALPLGGIDRPKREREHASSSRQEAASRRTCLRTTRRQTSCVATRRRRQEEWRQVAPISARERVATTAWSSGRDDNPS